MPKKIFTAVLALFLFALFAPKNNNFHSNVLQNIRITNVHEDTLPAAAVISQSHTQVAETINDNGEIYYPVTKVIDGDTIVLNIKWKNETIRLIGLDTPETVDPRKPVQCFGEQASDEAKKILAGKSVRIETDPSQGERDKYGRLLAYIYVANDSLNVDLDADRGVEKAALETYDASTAKKTQRLHNDGMRQISFNEYMIEEGFGHQYTYNLPYKYQKEFQDAEKTARENKIGLWADGACAPSAPRNVAEQTPKAADINTDGKTYDCSRNAYNCSSFTTQAEAQAAFDACGGTSNDIHKLDRDMDGKVCESLP